MDMKFIFFFFFFFKYRKYVNIRKFSLAYIYKSVGFILAFILSSIHGFHMVIEVKKCHNSLVIISLSEIQPLAANICLEQMFQKLKDKIVTKFEKGLLNELEKRMS